MLPNKPKFRSRKLDFKKALPIHFAEDLPDLDEDSSINRTVPIVATGVEKEEEEEHHLQAVISAAQVRDSKAASVYIPTPDASRLIDYYDKLYSRPFKMPTNLIRFSNVVEDCIGTAYCMDADDMKWLKSYNAAQTKRRTKENSSAPAEHVSETDFERLLSELEKATDDRRREGGSEALADFSDLESFLLLEPSTSGLKSAATSIFEYWRKKRELQPDKKPLIPQLRFDDGNKDNESDPYVCFRKREIRVTRKTRRTDAQSLQKLRQLRSELSVARSLLDMVCKREKLRKESILLDHVVFEQRILARNMTKMLGLPMEVVEEAKAQRKRALKLRGVGSPSPHKQAKTAARKRKAHDLDDYDYPKDPITIAIENDVHKRRLQDVNWEDLTDRSCLRFPQHPAHAFMRPNVIFSDKDQTVLPRARYRMGRVGRIWIDRRPARNMFTPDSSPPPIPDSSPPPIVADSKWKYDDFEDSTDEEVVLPLDKDLRQLIFRANLFNVSDVKQLHCIPAPQPDVPKPIHNEPLILIKPNTGAQPGAVSSSSSAENLNEKGADKPS